MTEQQQWDAVKTLLLTAIDEGRQDDVASAAVGKVAEEILSAWESHHHDHAMMQLVREDLLPASQKLIDLVAGIVRATTAIYTDKSGKKVRLLAMVWASTPKFTPIHVYELLDEERTPPEHVAIMLGVETQTWAYLPKDADILPLLHRDVTLLNQGEFKESDNIQFAWESLFLESLGYDLDVIYPQE